MLDTALAVQTAAEHEKAHPSPTILGHLSLIGDLLQITTDIRRVLDEQLSPQAYVAELERTLSEININAVIEAGLKKKGFTDEKIDKTVKERGYIESPKTEKQKEHNNVIIKAFLDDALGKDFGDTQFAPLLTSLFGDKHKIETALSVERTWQNLQKQTDYLQEYKALEKDLYFISQQLQRPKEIIHEKLRELSASLPKLMLTPKQSHWGYSAAAGEVVALSMECARLVERLIAGEGITSEMLQAYIHGIPEDTELASVRDLLEEEKRRLEKERQAKLQRFQAVNASFQEDDYHSMHGARYKSNVTLANFERLEAAALEAATPAEEHEALAEYIAELKTVIEAGSDNSDIMPRYQGRSSEISRSLEGLANAILDGFAKQKPAYQAFLVDLNSPAMQARIAAIKGITDVAVRNETVRELCNPLLQKHFADRSSSSMGDSISIEALPYSGSRTLQLAKAELTQHGLRIELIFMARRVHAPVSSAHIVTSNSNAHEPTSGLSGHHAASFGGKHSSAGLFGDDDEW